MTLRIGTQIYKGKAQLVTSDRNEADGFESVVNAALEQIRSTEVGAELLRANEGADEVLSVQKLQKRIQELISRNTIQSGHPAIVKFMKFHAVNSVHKTIHNRGDNRQYSVPLAHKPKDDRPHSTDQNLKNRILSFDERTSIDEGIGLVRYLQNGLVAYHIMDHLTPGTGTGAWVVWDPLLEDVGTNLPNEKRAVWMDRPPGLRWLTN